MKDTIRSEGTDGEKSKEPRMRQTLTLAAAVAMLGASVGVNVQELLASSPPGQMPLSEQSKLGSVQEKDRAMQGKVPAVQDKRVITPQKLDAVQDKEAITPGMKPVAPSRQMPTR